MAIDLTTVGVKLEARGVAQVKGAFASVKRELQGLVSPANLVKGALGGLSAAFVGGAVLRKLTAETVDAQRETAQLAAVLKSTGGAAGVTMGELNEMAASLQGLSIHSDGAIKGAQALLLTFTGIRGPQFKGATQAVLDMATAMGTDLKSASIQVGKALNDPVKGITALQRVGVSFTQSQKDVIEKLVETGQKAKAQELILKELQVEFGGSALAARNTLGGALTHLGNKWDELFEISDSSADGIAGAINRIADALPNAKAKIDTAFSGLIRWIKEVESRMAKLQSIAFAINRFFGGNAGGVGMPGARNSGSGGGRDGGPGGMMLPSVTVMAQKPAPRERRTDSPGSSGAGKGPKIPGFSMGATGQAQLDSIGASKSSEPFDMSDMGIGMTSEQLAELFEQKKAQNKEIVSELDRLNLDMAASIRAGIANTIGDAVYNAFAAAFNGEGLGGIFKAFGKTILAGLGDIMTQQGQALLTYGITMQAAAIGLSNPFTAGPAAIAAGLALIALGSAFGAIAKGGGGRGTAQSGAFRERPGEVVTRLKFVDRTGRPVESMRPVTVNATIIGTRDPKAQREIVELIQNAARRTA